MKNKTSSTLDKIVVFSMTMVLSKTTMRFEKRLSYSLLEPLGRWLRESWKAAEANVRQIIDLKLLYGETAKLEELPKYIEKAKKLAGEGNEVVLTGQAPVWLYLKVAHALHGKARRLIYSSPVTGEVVIFDHDPFYGRFIG